MSSDTKFAVNSRLPPNSIPPMLITRMLYVAFYSNRIQFRECDHVYNTVRLSLIFFDFLLSLLSSLFEGNCLTLVLSILSIVYYSGLQSSCWLTLIGSITEEDVSFKRERMEYFEVIRCKDA